MGTQAQRTCGCDSITGEIDRVVDTYSHLVYNVAFANLKNRHDADDVFQEVFLKYIKADKEFESEEHRKAWLIRVTINCCKTFFTSSWQKSVGLDECGEIAVNCDSTDSNELMNAVLRLPPKLKNAVLLFYYENMSVKEIADALKTSEGSVKTRLSRARDALRSELKGWYE